MDSRYNHSGMTDIFANSSDCAEWLRCFQGLRPGFLFLIRINSIRQPNISAPRSSLMVSPEIIPEARDSIPITTSSASREKSLPIIEISWFCLFLSMIFPGGDVVTAFVMPMSATEITGRGKSRPYKVSCHAAISDNARSASFERRSFLCTLPGSSGNSP